LVSRPILFLQSNQHSSVYIHICFSGNCSSATRKWHISNCAHNEAADCCDILFPPPLKFGLSPHLHLPLQHQYHSWYNRYRCGGTYVIQLTCSSLAHCWNSFCCRDPRAQTVGMGMGVPIAQFGWPMWLPVPVQGVQVFCRYRSRYNQKYPGVIHADHYLLLLGICPQKNHLDFITIGNYIFEQRYHASQCQPCPCIKNKYWDL